MGRSSFKNIRELQILTREDSAGRSKGDKETQQYFKQLLFVLQQPLNPLALESLIFTS
jgi:hypothetical protein